MSYYIEPRESLPSAAHRIASEQRDKARAALQQTEDPEEGIHTARKHFKKIRALMRLVRDEIGEPAYKKQNVYYRDMGRALSDLRDATSLLEALALLQDIFQEHVKVQTFRELETLLREERDQRWAQPPEEDSRPERVLKELEKSDDYINSLTVTEDGWDPLLESVRRVYKRGYKARARYFDEPSPANLHEWRKRAKYLWYHYRLLQKCWPPVFEGLAEEVHELSNILGDHRDLTLLLEKVRELESRLDARSVLVLEALARRYQQTLVKRAQHLGGKVYAETPAAFKKRMGEYLQAWRQERPYPANGKLAVEN